MELNKIYNEDCLEGLKRLPNNSVDLIVTSPPYFNAREYSNWETFEGYLESLLKQFRRDIVKINPVIKINNKGENILNHTAPFPLSIPEFAIKFFSGVGDVVLDTFMGSGTTAIACMNTERNFIGFELDKEYYEKSLERIKNHTTQTSLFEHI